LESELIIFMPQRHESFSVQLFGAYPRSEARLWFRKPTDPTATLWTRGFLSFGDFMVRETNCFSYTVAYPIPYYFLIPSTPQDNRKLLINLDNYFNAKNNFNNYSSVNINSIGYPPNNQSTMDTIKATIKTPKSTRRFNKLGSDISSQRRDAMAELAKSLQEELQQFHQFSLTDASTSFPYKILENKLNGSPLRAFFIKTLYEYAIAEAEIKEKPDKLQHKFFTLQLPFILESIICIQYCHNQILDRKGGVTTPAAINFNLIDGNQFERQLRIYVRRNTLIFDAVHFRAIEQQIEEILQLVDVGQEIEKRHLTSKGWESGIVEHRYKNVLEKHIVPEYIEFLMAATKAFYPSFPQEKKAFLELYFSKIYLINAVLYRNAARLIGTILGLNKELCGKLETMATLFALMHQMVNDNGDFIPPNKKESTVEKTIWDAFSDLKNENITLPIQLNLLLCKDEEKNIRSRIHPFYHSDSRNMTLDKTEEIFKELINSKAIFMSMSIAKQLKELAMEILGQDKPGEENAALQLLGDMFEVAENNKYYRHYYNERQAYRRYKKWKKEEGIERELEVERSKFHHEVPYQKTHASIGHERSG